MAISVWGPVKTTPDEFENGDFTLKTHQRFSVHTTPEKFENGGFTLKTHQMFSVHTTPVKLENATITGHFGFVFKENSVRKIKWLWWRFRKNPFSKCFLTTRKRKADVFKVVLFDERFRRAPLLWQIRMDGRPNPRNNAAFSNFSGVV